MPFERPPLRESSELSSVTTICNPPSGTSCHFRVTIAGLRDRNVEWSNTLFFNVHRHFRKHKRGMTSLNQAFYPNDG
jgi:hypothetical protein